MIKFKEGDATNPQGKGPKIIVHICNDIGAWGKGFVLALSKKWDKPEKDYRNWHKHPGKIPFQLGEVQFVKVEKDLWVTNLIGQHHIIPEEGNPPIRYDAVKKGLIRVAEFAEKHKATIHMPRIGCGLAGGKWEKIEQIIKETIAKKFTVCVYDLKQSIT